MQKCFLWNQKETKHYPFYLFVSQVQGLEFYETFVEGAVETVLKAFWKDS